MRSNKYIIFIGLFLIVSIICFWMPAICSDYSYNQTIIRVETNPKAFYGREFRIRGCIKVYNYYNYGYRDAKKTHFSFRLKDTTGTANVYGKKSQFGYLRDKLLKNGNSGCGNFILRIKKSRYSEDSSDIFAELMRCTLKD